MAGEPLGFKDVLEGELAALAKLERIEDLDTAALRTGKPPLNEYARAHLSQLTGLAFSGGGIRSATFCLGVLQGLAEYRLLGIFDYLSTVSGGGYIGSWLSAWVHREGIDEVEKRLEQEIERRRKREEIPEDVQWSPITFLRRYSNYLTPETGLLSLDTWTAVATYGRNLLLNLSIIALALGAALILPRLVVEAFLHLRANVAPSWLDLALVVPAGLLVLLALRGTTLNLLGDDHLRRSGAVQAWVVAPLALAAVLIGLWMPSGRLEILGDPLSWLPLGLLDPQALSEPALWFLRWMIGFAAGYLLLWVLAILIAGRPRGRKDAAAGPSRRKRVVDRLMVAATGLVAGAVGGAFLASIAGGFQRLLENTASSAIGWLEVATWGPPAVLLAFVLIAFVHVGLVGRGFEEAQRQWASRLAGSLLIVALAWTAAFTLVFYGPALLNWLGRLSGGLGLGWVAAAAIGLWAGRQANGRGKLGRWATDVAPYIFSLGLILALSWAIHRIFKAFAPAGEGRTSPSPEPIGAAAGFREHWGQVGEIAASTLQDAPWVFPIGFGLLVVAVLVLSWRVDINEFSMHNFYRNRLVRAYLGASRVTERRPNPFTGFDRADDVQLADLKSRHVRPIQILNTTLNLSAGEELAFQERKAASFFFTPFHYGFDPGVFGAGFKESGFQPTPDSELHSLGTAMAISGAAANPAMGAETSPALAFLMTVFNIRLGWWLANPSLSKRRQGEPLRGVDQRRCELFGSTDARAPYVNLGDGGFFDNLGLYELVRRRCRFILVCDAESDPNYEFNALGNAIRRCRSDFGIDIRIQLDPIRRQAESGQSHWHCAVGEIRYATDDNAPKGTLVYLKASLTGDEPEDLRNYAIRNPEFPHESTVDQWFGEAQFESYRMLGYHSTVDLLETAGVEKRPSALLEAAASTASTLRRVRSEGRAELVFLKLRRSWYPPTPATARSFTRHTEKLVEIFERLRGDRRLAFLDRNLYLDLEEWMETGEVAPAKGARSEAAATTRRDQEEQLRSGFYLCSSMIQLMENVYLDLDLDQDWEHPDNRGWMNLFRHWASTAPLRKTWAVGAATYGARFQTFCERRLRLGLGTVWAEMHEVDEPLEDVLTEVEEDILQAVMAAEAAEAEGRRLAGQHPRESEHLSILKMGVRGTWGRFAGEESSADGEPPRDSRMTINLGFALLCEVGDTMILRFFRIRNHLRQLGLGGRAMKVLIQRYGVRRDELVYLDFAPKERQRIKNLFHSTLNELGRREAPLPEGREPVGES